MTKDDLIYWQKHYPDPVKLLCQMMRRDDSRFAITQFMKRYNLNIHPMIPKILAEEALQTWSVN